MRIAIPVVEGCISDHFGHSEAFMFFDVSDESKEVVNIESVVPPPHKPGLLPRWLNEHGVGVIIAGGIGSRAHQLFQERNIEVIAGAKTKEPEQAVKDYLAGSIESDGTLCEH